MLSKDKHGRLCPVESDDPLAQAARQLSQGAILAIKGLGGYHLSCDALHVEAVQHLRQRKHRGAKPFALMVPDIETARQLCFVSDADAELLESRRRPIVLLRQRATSPLAPAVAPAYQTLGIMLPYTPLHHLLLSAFRTLREAGRPVVLVMTSGNLSDEPIAYQDDDARERLYAIADGMLTHSRSIHMRCDDSVVRIAAGGVQFFRRSRGYAPEPVVPTFDLPVPLLACSAHLKNTFCLGKGRQAFLSHHIGDLENLETLISFREGIEHFQRLFDITPEAVAYDLHPEYLATKYALDSTIPQKIGVQHHYAHIASVLAEHGLSGPVIGIAAEGFILEEGFSIAELRSIVESMTVAARDAGVSIVTGDTKVVQRGKADGVFINTAGVGIVRTGTIIGQDQLKPGDKVLLSGPIGDHGVAIMLAREMLDIETNIQSDSAPLHTLVASLLDVAGSGIHCLKDPTRGGVATSLNEMALASQVAVTLDEPAIPVRPEVRGACELLGLDPLTIANEGKLLAVVAPEVADTTLNAMRAHPLGCEAAIIGTVQAEPKALVFLRTDIGGKRILDMLVGDPLPRIC